MRELDDLMVKVAQVRWRLGRRHQWIEVWSGTDKIISWLQRDELVVDKERQRHVAGEELAVLRMNGYVKVRTLHVQTEHEILGLDDRLEHAEILVSRLALDRCLVEAAEGVYDALLALARRSMNSRSGEKLLASLRQVLIRPNSSALEQILNRKVDVLRVDKFRRRRFRRKGQALFELHLDSMLDVANYFLGGKVERLFPPGQGGLQLGGVE